MFKVVECMSKIFLIELMTAKAFPIGGEVTIGSDSDCEISWSSSSLAPKHLRVCHKSDNFFVEALDNKNTVNLNGVRLLAGQKYLIKKGDSLGFAGREFVLSSNEEVPEKTQTQVKDDIFGFGISHSSPEPSYGSLKLDTSYGAPKVSVKDEMKKSRRMIVEIQQTRKQLMAKSLEREKLLQELPQLKAESKKIEEALSSFIYETKEEFLALRQAELSEVDLIENKITQLKERLTKLMTEKEKRMVKMSKEEKVSELFDHKDQLVQKLAEAQGQVRVIESLEIEQKMAKLDDCLKEEQENYQKLYDFKSLNSSPKKD